jgi:hypothetical protein
MQVLSLDSYAMPCRVLCYARAVQVVPYLIPSGTEGPGKIKTSTAGQLVVSPSGRYVAVLDRHSCFVWAAGSSATGSRAKPLNLPHTKPYTVRTLVPPLTAFFSHRHLSVQFLVLATRMVGVKKWIESKMTANIIVLLTITLFVVM